MIEKKIKKIAIIGNAAGGKTRLARALALQFQVQLIHVDSIQFLPGLKRRSNEEVIKLLCAIQNSDNWLIDGYGPLDILIERLDFSDLIVFIDFPLWRHLWWALKRQCLVLLFPRGELPDKCNEFSWNHSRRIFRGIFSEYRQMRPELIRILSQNKYRDKTLYIQSLKEWTAVSSGAVKDFSFSRPSA
jgi:hypothetical protein